MRSRTRAVQPSGAGRERSERYRRPLDLGSSRVEGARRDPQDIVTFQGGAAQILVEAPLIYKVHIFLGITIFLVFPFTRLVHIWSAPIWYLGRSFQLVRQRLT